MKRRLVLLAVLVGVLIFSGGAKAASIQDVAGRVFADANANGQWDAGAKGVAGGAVSDGRDIVASGSDGSFALKVDAEKCPFVFITTPSGYKNSSAFYRRVAPGGKGCDFGLIAAPETASKAFSFIHIADLHITDEGSVKMLLDDLREMAAQPEKPRFVIPTGDLVNQGGERKEYENYTHAVQASGMTFYHVMGNHDLPAKNYEEFLGPSYYSFDYGQKHFVVLNCLEPDRHAEWLKKDLDLQPKGKGILVFQHYQPAKELLELLSRYSVEGLFNGHWHSNKVFRYGKILVVSTTPPRFGGIDVNPRGFRVVTVGTDGHVRTQFRWGGGKAKIGQIPDGVKEMVWARTVGGETGMSSPRVEGKRMYIGVQDDHNAEQGGVVCLDARNGVLLWKFTTGNSVNGAPAVSDGIVVTVSVTGTVYGLDAKSGKELWRGNLGEFCDRWVYNSPVIAGGAVYCGVAPYFAALDLKSGKQLWQAPSMGGDWISSRTSPFVDDDRVFMGVNWSNGLFALDRKDGKAIWNNKEGYGVTHSSPVVYQKMLFYASDNLLHAMDKASGKELWRAELPGGWPVSAPAVQDGLAVIGTPDGKISAYKVDTGQNVWSVQTTEAQGSFSSYGRDGSQVMSTPTIADGKVYSGSNDGRLYVIDLKTGKCLRNTYLGFPILSSPTVSGDRIYVARWDGVVMSLTR